MHDNADEGVAYVQELAEEEAFAVEFGHEGAASVDDGDICHAGGGGSYRAEIPDPACAEELVDDGLAGDVLWWG